MFKKNGTRKKILKTKTLNNTMAKTSVENKHYLLLESINIVAEISCSRCDKEDSMDCFDIEEAIEGYYNDGWRATDKHTYCKKCAKKYLKN